MFSFYYFPFSRTYAKSPLDINYILYIFLWKFFSKINFMQRFSMYRNLIYSGVIVICFRRLLSILEDVKNKRQNRSIQWCMELWFNKYFNIRISCLELLILTSCVSTYYTKSVSSSILIQSLQMKLKFSQQDATGWAGPLGVSVP